MDNKQKKRKMADVELFILLKINKNSKNKYI